MATFFALLRQIAVMFLMGGVGFVLSRSGKVSADGSKSLGNILIYVVLPCVIIQSFWVEKTPERIKGLLLSTFFAFSLLILSTVVSRIAFRGDAIGQFAAAYSNPGFFGVPLITALLSEGAAFYIAGFIAFLNLIQWVYGVSIMTGQMERITAKKLVTAPFFIAIVIGMLFFWTEIQPPALIVKTIGYLAGINTPLAMFSVGIYLAQVDAGKMIRRRQNYRVSLFRLIIIPILSIFLLLLIPQQYAELKIALLIAAVCPVGSNIAVYAQLHGRDFKYAIETVVISTVFSVATIPTLVSVASAIFDAVRVF